MALSSRPFAGALLLSLLLAGCAVEPGGEPVETVLSDHAQVREAASDYTGTVVEPAVPRPELTLLDTDGAPFSLHERPAGEVTVVFFGYTHCPDVCPTTMADLAAARRQMPEHLRDNVVVAFVTEDPERDSPAVLRDWLDAMDSEFVGLRGGNDDTAAALRELYLPETSIIPTPNAPVVHPDDGHAHPGDYGVDHPGVVYAFGPEQTLLYTGGIRPQQYAEDFALLAGAGAR